MFDEFSCQSLYSIATGFVVWLACINLGFDILG